MTARLFTVSRSESGRTIAELLRARLNQPFKEVRRLIEGGSVRLGGTPCRDPGRRLRTGERIQIDAAPAQRQEAEWSGPRPVIRFADAQVVVVDKPPGLTTMRHPDEVAEFGERGRRFLPRTLADLLPALLAQREGGARAKPLRAVHRLDKETSGLVVFARTPEAERHLGKQFRAHTTERRYLALVRGEAVDARIESLLVRDRGDGRRGSTRQPGEGQRAVTHVRVVERLGDFTLVECSLETGRTHQVRIHLGEAGTPICGERIYDRPLHGRPAPDESGAPRIMLHAAELGFVHPATGKTMRWAAALPEDMRRVVERLRAKR